MARRKDSNFGSNLIVTIVGTVAASALYEVLKQNFPDMLRSIGRPMTILVCLVVVLVSVIFFNVYVHYVGVLGAGRSHKGTPRRLAYDALRNSVEAGGYPAHLYAEKLIAFLSVIDRFFGDLATSGRLSTARAFGLRNPSPLWTAPSFDRCLLLALIYPTAAIVFIWAVSGHVGLAETGLRLPADFAGWKRAVAVTAFAAGSFAQYRFFRSVSRGQTGSIWMLVVVLAGTTCMSLFLSAKALPFVIIILLVLFSSHIIYHVSRFSGVGFGTVAIIHVVFKASVSDLDAFHHPEDFLILALYVAVIICGALAVRHNARGPFLVLLVAFLFAVSFFVAYLEATLPNWIYAAPLVLILCVLTLLNAPFDWLSLGLTRAFLRLGVERGGWMPYVFALADALVAVALIVVLACTMVVVIQAFNMVAVLGGAPPTLPLEPLFAGIARNPSAPEYWWIYALLLSTMIPSVVNLVIGGTSLTRGIPWLSRIVLRQMPTNYAVLDFDRNWVALLLTAQWAIGAALGIAAQVALITLFVGKVMPAIGFDILDIVRWVSRLDLPSYIHHLFG
jgi:hypothetical protein